MVLNEQKAPPLPPYFLDLGSATHSSCSSNVSTVSLLPTLQACCMHYAMHYSDLTNVFDFLHC